MTLNIGRPTLIKQGVIKRERLLKYVTEHPNKTNIEIADALRWDPKTTQRHLAMLHEAGQIRKVRHIPATGRISYKMGYAPGKGDEEKPRPPKRSAKTTEAASNLSGQVRRVIVPAVQMGLSRDPMIEAFYGQEVRA